MNQTHLHLLITHLPIFGSILGAVVLAYGLWTKSNHTRIAAYTVFIISSIGAGIAYLTGEAAEEKVEDIQGVAKKMIEEHEEFALIALVSLIILGLASIVGLFLTIRKPPLAKTISWVILLISLISFGLVAWTGYMGGQIRHTEINSNTTIQVQGGESNDNNKSMK
jgi:uncharacterized membrane protein